jgi:C1A family cysteine protease
MPARRRQHGTHPDVPDLRDHEYQVPARLRQSLPPAVDLRPHCPPVYQQGKLNSCSANAIAAALWYDEIKRGSSRPPAPSRLFIYYNERAREGLTASNAPVSLRDGYQSVAKNGACHEKRWPYREDLSTRKPPPRCYQQALAYRVISYYRIRRELEQFKACLAEGYPFTFGISVYESLESRRVARSGIVPLPARHEKHLGGHAMLAVGYQEGRRMFIVRNSWGARWGIRGYCLLPYDFLLHPSLSWDFWTARRLK